jgi:WD40 repeat protein
VEVKSSDWDASAADVRRALASDIYALKEMDVGPEKNPTYFFKTRDGAEGILQLLAVEDNPKGIRLRYKTLLSDRVGGGEVSAAPQDPKADATGPAPADANRKFEHTFGLELRLAYTEPAEGRIEVASPGGKTSAYVEKEPIATSVDIVQAEAIDDAAGQRAVQITFSDEAAARLSKATEPHRGKPIAILFDGMLLTAPTVHEPIGSKAVITGRFNAVDVKRLVDALNPGPRPEAPRPVRIFKTSQGVQTIATSPDGQLIAVAGGNPTLILQGDGTSRVKGDWKPTVEILNAETGHVVASLDLTTVQEEFALAATPRISHVEATALAFSANGSLLAVGTNIGQMKLYVTRTSTVRPYPTPDDRDARLADKKTPKSWKAVPRAMGSVRSLAVSQDAIAVCGQSFADFADIFDGIERSGRSITAPGRLKIWHGRELKHDLIHSQAYAVAFSTDGSILASAGRWDSGADHGNGVIVWDPQTGDKTRTIAIEANGGTHSIAFSPTKKLMTIGSRVFDKENDPSKTLITVAYPLSGITEWQQSVPGWAKPVFSPDGKTVVVLCGGESLRFFDTETGTMKREIKTSDMTGGGRRWNDLAVAPTADLLAVGGADDQNRGIVTLWKW